MGMAESDSEAGEARDNAPNGDALWTVKQCAKYLNVSESWVYRRTETGEIPHAKLGGHLRFHPARVRAYAADSMSGKVANVIRLRKCT